MSFNIENLIGITTVLEDDGLSFIWTSVPKFMQENIEENEGLLEMVGDLNALISQGFQDLGLPLISARFKVMELFKKNTDQIIPQTLLFIANEEYPLTFIIISSRVVHFDLILDISHNMGMVLKDFMKIYKKYLIKENPQIGIRNFLNQDNGVNYFPSYIDHKINSRSLNDMDSFFNFSIAPRWLNFKREKFSNPNDMNDFEEEISLEFETTIDLLDERIEFDELFFQYLSGLTKSIYDGMLNLGDYTKRDYKNVKPLIDFCVFKSEKHENTYLNFQGLYNHYYKSNEIVIDSILFSGVNSTKPSFNENINLLKNKFNNLLLKMKNKNSNQIEEEFNEFHKQNFSYMARK